MKVLILNLKLISNKFPMKQGNSEGKLITMIILDDK